MNGFFFPKSIAIFGVSSSQTNLARVIVENLNRFKFKGELFLIGDKDREIMGKRVYKDIDDVENIPELAVFLIPAKKIPEALEDCGKKGIKRIVIESGGFSEFGEERRLLEKEILQIAKKWEMKIVGPNCVGTINVSNGVALPFYPLDPEYVKNGPVSLISQSGGLIHDITLLSSCENVGIGKLVSIGNKLMLDENDFLEFFISDPDTHIIGLYLESIQNGRRFMRLAASTDKPIIILKSNITPSGHAIAKFHTTALAGDDDVLDAALKQIGAHRVYSIQEMVECFKIFLLPLVKGKSLAVMSRSGGHAVLSADAVYRYGFKLTRLSSKFLKSVKEKSRAGVINFTNPLDLGDIFDIEFYGELVKNMLKEKNVNGIVVVHPWDIETERVATKNFIITAHKTAEEHNKPVVFCMISDRKNWFQMKEATNFPIFTDVDSALKMLSKSYKQYSHRKNRLHKTFNTYQQKRITAHEIAKANFMPPQEVFNLLGQHDIPVAEYSIVKTLKQAIEAARNIGYPVVIKDASPNIIHKTETGGVILNIPNEKVLKKAYKDINSDTKIVQKMYKNGFEIIIGGKHDPQFGPVVLLGLGGIFTEIFNTKTLRIAPIDHKIANEMIDELKGTDILKGFRGKREADINSLIEVLIKISNLLMKYPEIITVDINPLIVFEKQKGCVVVDGKIAFISPVAGRFFY